MRSLTSILPNFVVGSPAIMMPYVSTSKKLSSAVSLLLKTAICVVISVRYSSCMFGETWSKFEYRITVIYRRRDRAWGSPSPMWDGYRVFFCPMVKRLGREAEDSLASHPEDKNEWSCTSPDPIYLYGVHRDIFTFTLTRGETVNCFEMRVIR